MLRMRNNKVNYLIFMLTILVLHTIVLSYWLSKEVNKTSLNAGKKNNFGQSYHEIIPAMQLRIDTILSK